MKKTTLLALLIIIAGLGASQMALADNSTLSVSPASLNSAVGVPFNVSIQLNPANNKVCVVMGVLSLNNLSCQAITVADGLYTVVTPTCAKPSFLIGIPKCSTATQSIFSLSVQGIQAGEGSLSFTDVKVIGAGTDVAFSSQGGAYNIEKVAVAQKQTTSETSTPETEQQPAEIPAEVPIVESPNFSLAALSDFITLGIRNNIIGIIILFLICLIIYFVYSYFVRKKK